MFDEAIAAEAEAALAGEGAASDETLLAALEATLRAFDCVVGTIHDIDAATGLLRLRVHRGIPPAIMDQVKSIPVGKGMAGLAAERREPVQVCNLQTDESGVAKPGARKTGVEGSIAFPAIADGTLRGAMGVAKATAYEFDEKERAALMRIGAAVARRLG